MKPYQIEGDFQMGRVRQHFVLQVAAKDETAARERVYAILGSRHGAARREVRIQSAKSIPADEVTDPTARVAMRHG